MSTIDWKPSDRTRYVSIRVTEQTLTRWKKAAIDAGTSLQALIETAVGQNIKRPRSPRRPVA